MFEGLWYLPSRAYTLCDVANGGISPKAEREKQGAAFSQLTARFSQSRLVRQSDHTSRRLSSYDSFKGKDDKVGVVPGTTGESYAHELAKRSGLSPSVFVRYASESALLPALKKGEISAIARGEIGNEYQASLDSNFVTVAKHDFNEGFAFAVDAANTKLLNELNRAIKELTQDGKLGYRDWLKDRQIFAKRAQELRSKAARP